MPSNCSKEGTVVAPAKELESSAPPSPGLWGPLCSWLSWSWATQRPFPPSPAGHRKHRADTQLPGIDVLQPDFPSVQPHHCTSGAPGSLLLTQLGGLSLQALLWLPVTWGSGVLSVPPPVTEGPYEPPWLLAEEQPSSQVTIEKVSRVCHQLVINLSPTPPSSSPSLVTSCRCIHLVILCCGASFVAIPLSPALELKKRG